MNSQLFKTMTPTRLFFKCAIPAMIGMAVSACYTIVDGIFVGHFIGQEALAAVNLIMPLAMIVFAISDMIAAGSSVRISMLLGQGDRKGANQTFSFCVKAILVFSVLITILGLLFSKALLMLMGVRGTALLYAEEYVHVFACFAPVCMPFFAMDNYLRICGKENYSMGLNVITSVLNIILDYLLIVVWKQGIWAAAFASCIGITVGTILSFLPFLMGKVELQFTKGNIPLLQFGKLLANGSSEFFGSIAGSVLSLVINVLLLALGGTTAVAAFSVIMYVSSVVENLTYGMISALQPAISYCYGADMKKRVKALQIRVMLAAATLSAIALVIMRYGGEIIIPLFVKTQDYELMQMSLHGMKLYALSYLVSWIDNCLSGYLTALEYAGRSLVLSLLGTLVFPCLTLAVLVPVWELDGVWMMPSVTGLLSAVAAIVAIQGIGLKKQREKESY